MSNELLENIKNIMNIKINIKKEKKVILKMMKNLNIILEIIGLFMVIIGLLISKEIIYISIILFLLSIFSNLYTNGGCL